MFCLMPFNTRRLKHLYCLTPGQDLPAGISRNFKEGTWKFSRLLLVGDNEQALLLPIKGLCTDGTIVSVLSGVSMGSQSVDPQ